MVCIQPPCQCHAALCKVWSRKSNANETDKEAEGSPICICIRSPVKKTLGVCRVSEAKEFGKIFDQCSVVMLRLYM